MFARIVRHGSALFPPSSSRRAVLAILVACGVATWALAAPQDETSRGRSRPNIVFILADDIGYGDFGCYGATKIKTPNIDRLAAEGRRFTDAHSPSAVCTPTRYALMTGEYAWRKPGTGILPGTAALIIEPGRLTVPALLKRAGYTTGVVGKWHLGLGATAPTDYNGVIKPGPLEIGFDYAWLLPATGDRTPCVWIENHRVVGLDPADPISLDYSIERGHPLSYVNGIPRIGRQIGGKAALWKDDEIADVLTGKAVAFIEKHKDRPFFLYFATHDIHVPRVPHARFRGTSQAGVRGDVVQEFDWSVGEVLKVLDRLGLADNTLVMVTSDNGGVLDTNGPDHVNSGTVETNNGHMHNGPLRGNKGSPYEGGTRVPFVARWPGHVKPGTSDALICHVDLLATAAAITGQTLPEEAGPDSFNILPALLGDPRDRPCRDHLVEHGNRLALRLGTWKYIPAAAPKAKRGKRAGEDGELYDLATDLGETTNLAAQHPERVKQMAALLQRIRSEGRSRP
ncbi:MAG: arylsulfatase [Thermoguttaceae bacterium]|nr:arylsulfatase [Thermoguttaceae bacterium]